MRHAAQHGDTAVYTLDSIDAVDARPRCRNAPGALGFIALGSLALAGFASVWLARTVARPIDTLSTAR